MSLVVNFVHTLAFSPALESFIVATFGDLEGKVDALKASTDAKLGEFAAEIKTLADEVADLNTKITDPAAIDALAVKLDDNKTAVEAVKVIPDAPAV